MTELIEHNQDLRMVMQASGRAHRLAALAIGLACFFAGALVMQLVQPSPPIVQRLAPAANGETAADERIIQTQEQINHSLTRIIALLRQQREQMQQTTDRLTAQIQALERQAPVSRDIIAQVRDVAQTDVGLIAEAQEVLGVKVRLRP
ncbi:MAG: hypothetical protein CV088_06450 [Nitrospira sp. LK70]|nr:hypothetical protein [Nitrospira sp. LK70]